MSVRSGVPVPGSLASERQGAEEIGAEYDPVFRRRLLVSGTVLIAAHLLYTVFHIVTLLLPERLTFIDTDVLRASIATNLVLDVAAAGYLVTLARAGRRARGVRFVRWAGVVFCLVANAVWGAQAHFGGSQSSHLLALVLSTLLVFAWILPLPHFLLVTGLTTAGLFGMVGLEAAGILPYAPLLPGIHDSRHVFLDWRVLVVNAAIYACTLSVSIVAMLVLKDAARKARADLERRVEERTSALRIERENLQAVFNASPVALLVIDADAAIVFANVAAIRVADLEDPAVAVGRRPGNLLGCANALGDAHGCGASPSCADCPLCVAFQSVLKAGEARTEEVCLDTLRDGTRERHWLRVGLEPFVLDGRRHVVMAIEDVTEARRLAEERRLSEARSRQQQKLEAIGTLASGVAHEINNPLNVILNFAEVIRESPDDSAVCRQSLDQIVHEGERVAWIVRNLLAFARTERDFVDPEDIADLVQRTLSLVQALIRKDRIRLEVDVAAGLPPVRCRPQAIQQVLMNLVTNARDAILARGEHADDEGVIRIRAALAPVDGRPFVRVTVEDDGAGIAPEVAPRVFDPFFTTKPRDQGTGLGLSISYGIAREYGGALWFEPATPRGTAFHLDLPPETQD